MREWGLVTSQRLAGAGASVVSESSLKSAQRSQWPLGWPGITTLSRDIPRRSSGKNIHAVWRLLYPLLHCTGCKLIQRKSLMAVCKLGHLPGIHHANLVLSLLIYPNPLPLSPYYQNKEDGIEDGEVYVEYLNSTYNHCQFRIHMHLLIFYKKIILSFQILTPYFRLKHSLQ